MFSNMDPAVVAALFGLGGVFVTLLVQMALSRRDGMRSDISTLQDRVRLYMEESDKERAKRKEIEIEVEKKETAKRLAMEAAALATEKLKESKAICSKKDEVISHLSAENRKLILRNEVLINKLAGPEPRQLSPK